MSEWQTIEVVRDTTKLPPICADLDEDCPTVEDWVACWLYDPARGFCPYLRTPDTQERR